MIKLSVILVILLLLSPYTAAIQSGESAETYESQYSISNSKEFDGVKALVGYIVKDKIPQKDYKYIFSNDNKNKDILSVYIPDTSYTDVQLTKIQIIGDNIYYSYTDKAFLKESQVKEQNDGLNDQTTPSEDKSTIEFESPTATDPQSELLEFGRYLSIGWNYKGYGTKGLNYLVDTNKGVIKAVKSLKGFYYSDIKDFSGTLIIGKTVYWVENNCMVQATIPIKRYNSFVSYMKENKKLIKKEKYSKKTFEKIK